MDLLKVDNSSYETVIQDLSDNIKSGFYRLDLSNNNLQMMEHTAAEKASVERKFCIDTINHGSSTVHSLTF